MYAKQRAMAAPSMALRERAHGKGWLASKDEELSSVQKPSEKGQMKFIKVSVTEGLSEDSVRKIIERDLHAMNACYKQGSGQRSRPTGHVVFILVIGPDGRVKKAQIEKDKEGYTELAQCVAKRLKALRFPVQTGRKDMEVTITLALI